MEIVSVRHKALRRFIEEGKAKGLIEPGRLQDMVAFILSAPGLEALATPPNFGFHALRGDREGTFAMTVTRNWRLTFTLRDGAIADLDLEDYH